MKTILITIAILSLLSMENHAQSNINLGAGYFGHMFTHPGLVIELEMEEVFSEKASVPVRINLGAYTHKRNHNGMFIDINYGFRRYFRSGFFLEESIGVGVLFSSLNSDGVYEVNDLGDVNEVAPFLQPDVMPSVTLGIGYNIGKSPDKKNLVWFRPKLMWQFPHKRSAMYTPTIQLGFTHTIGNKIGFLSPAG